MEEADLMFESAVLEVVESGSIQAKIAEDFQKTVVEEAVEVVP